ncbi:phenylacetate--CoA ligase family protein, partial [candidate division KSB1 bacterium]|nr:phenylacetate--CoA ligase family protein [candidate division KSB1 bacterium]
MRGEKVFAILRAIDRLPRQSRESIEALAQKKREHLLDIAFEQIPYYKKKYSEKGLSRKAFDLERDWNRLPILHREQLQSQKGKELQNPNLHRRVSRERTSGSSGKPLLIVKDRAKSGYSRAVMYRCYRQYGIDIGSRQARFWGVPPNPKQRFKERLKDLLANRIRLSAFDLNEKTLRRFTHKLLRFKPSYFYGYPTVMHRYAEWLERSSIDLSALHLKAIIATSEILYAAQRQTLERVFHAPVVNEYGCTEIGIIAFECPHGNMHINSDLVFVESLQMPKKPQQTLLLTELQNEFNPLIRYDIGDLGALSSGSCTCQSSLPTLDRLVGRDASFIVTPRGRLVNDAILDYVFQGGIDQFQAIQHHRDQLEIRLCKGPLFDEDLFKRSCNTLQKVLGPDITISYRFVPHLSPEKSGKIRLFISKIIPDNSNSQKTYECNAQVKNKTFDDQEY